MIMININKLLGGNITITTQVANPKTKITFDDGTSQEYDWSGEITYQTMIDAGLYNGDNSQWIKMPQTIEIGTNVTNIGWQAFYSCSGLTSVTIPNGVKEIGYQAFENCSKLMSLTIPDSVTNIFTEAFCFCIDLTSVTIPDSVTSIGGSAFLGCSKLTSVTITANDGNAENVKQMMINEGVSSGITWNMPS